MIVKEIGTNKALAEMVWPRGSSEVDDENPLKNPIFETQWFEKAIASMGDREAQNSSKLPEPM